MNIDARELTLVYDGDKANPTVAVDHVDISFRQDDMVGIMGPSGGGKSSLLYLLAGLKEPSSGSVFYDGRDAQMLSEKERDAIRSSRFGFIFQRHYLIAHLTLLENILMPVKAVAKGDVDGALDLMSELDLIKLKDRLPGAVSVGQRQKAAVLRALVHHPKVLFADEPTAALDIDSAMRVMELLEEHKQGMAIIVVTHDYRILKTADRVVHMRDGRIAG